MASHSVAELTSTSSWAMVEDKFSPYAKETLAKLIAFFEVRRVPRCSVPLTHLAYTSERRKSGLQSGWLGPSSLMTRRGGRPSFPSLKNSRRRLASSAFGISS
ncbi:hypothetical protein H4582DRAFT_2027739 [Lactarius indigo]|nr:hypothetical protein H4582DRAFT_2027739 [Lactarius indigo]